MISGKLGEYPEPTSYSSGTQMYNFGNDALPANAEEELKQAIAQASKDGYTIGTKVRQKKYVSDRVGIIVKYADNVTDGFSTWGTVQPLGVRYGEAQYIGYWSQDEMEIVP